MSAHLGDEEREDLSEIATIAMLEVSPFHANEGWLLRIILEDELGPRASDGGVDDSREQQIDLGTIYKEFIRPGRGTASVIAEVKDDAAKVRVNRLISAIETNQHEADRDAPGT